jgi:hypothetical protein
MQTRYTVAVRDDIAVNEFIIDTWAIDRMDDARLLSSPFGHSIARVLFDVHTGWRLVDQESRPIEPLMTIDEVMEHVAAHVTSKDAACANMYSLIYTCGVGTLDGHAFIPIVTHRQVGWSRRGCLLKTGRQQLDVVCRTIHNDGIFPFDIPFALSIKAMESGVYCTCDLLENYIIRAVADLRKINGS